MKKSLRLPITAIVMSWIRKSLVLRLLLPTIAVVVAMMALLGGFAAHILESEIRERAAQQVEEQTGRVIDALKTIDVLSSASAHSAVKVLMQEGRRGGDVSIGSDISLDGKSAPDLRFGGKSQTGSFELVDHIKDLMGGTATLFAASGDSFIRVSTNVVRADGGRAVGTLLDPKGKAYASIREGHAFYGVVDILGKPYMTAYEPMRDRNGAIVGIWYTGHPLSSLGDLGAYLAHAHILDHGYMVLLRSDGTPVFRPAEIDDAQMQSVLAGDAKGWNSTSRSFDPWNYRVVIAYPESDVSGRLLHMKGLLAICTLAISVLVVLVIVWILRSLVLAPVRGLATRLVNADLNTMLREPREDEIGQLAASFGTFVLHVRTTLLEVSRVSSHLNESAAAIAASAAIQADMSADGSAQAGRVVEAIEGVSATIEQVSEKTSRAARAAQETAEHACSGREAAVKSTGSMKNLAAAVEGSAKQVAELEAHSSRIGSAIVLINEIAEQTNLLALNAAIEAARAGDSGRGFAVVAGEVRRLAERTTAATREIGQMVGAIQAETKRTVRGIAENRDAAAVESRRSGETGEHLERITEMARQVGDMIVQIASAATEQTASMQLIGENVDRMAEAEKTTADEAGQSAEGCQELSRLAMKLQSLVDEFDLRQEDVSVPQGMDARPDLRTASRPSLEPLLH
jgi:methyl-accepting chemotaxis protein